MLRLIFYALLVYIAYQVLRLLLRSSNQGQPPEAGVRGRQKQKSLDLSGMDVEDAKFEEIKKKR